MWSEDGHWWWDGARWVSAAELRRARNRAWRADLLIPIGIFLLVPCVVVAAFVLTLVVNAIRH